MIPQAYGKHYISIIGMYKMRSEPQASEGGGNTQGRRLAYSTSSAGAGAVLKRPSCQSPWAGEGPSPGALALTVFTWGPQEEPKRCRALRGSHLDVHTELPTVCVQRSHLDVHTELPIVCVQRSRLDVHTVANCLCTWPQSLRCPI